MEGVDENKIEEHLEKQGISSMLDVGARKLVIFTYLYTGYIVHAERGPA